MTVATTRATDGVAAKVLRAREEERARLARELHDDIGQTLTILLIRLRIAEGLADGVALRDELTELRSLVTGALDSVRRLSHDLGPGVLDELGLAGGLLWLVDRLRTDTGLDIALEVRLDGVPLPSAVALALYRVGQEALTNVVRHAGAATASVRLTVSCGALRLEVRDRGNGAAAPFNEGAGISGMRERMALIGGTLRIESTPGGGTIVVATAPLEVK